MLSQGHYFQGREIQVMTNQPLKRILHKPDMTGRLTAWTIELRKFYIEYIPPTTMKAQVLSDFVAECQFTEVGKYMVMKSIFM